MSLHIGSFADIQEYKYVEKTITNRNEVHDEIKEINSGNAFHY
jgi:hypothetical protein